MKKYLKNFMLTQEMVTRSIYNCLNHRRWKRKDTSYLLAEYSIKMTNSKTNIDIVAREIRNTAYQDKAKLRLIVDYMSKEIYKEIKERNIQLPPISYQMRKDDSNGKMREIGISSMKQQLYDYIAVDCCYKMFMAKYGTYQCASIKGRGQLYGKNAIEKWFRKNPKKSKWIIQCDIRKYYPSVDKDVLKNLLQRDIANDDVLYIIFTLIDSYKEGLCIGSYLSQHLANYLLSYAYHYLDEFCFKIRRGKRQNLVWKKLFYMDDIFLCGSSQKDVKKDFKMLKKYLNDELHLSVKDGYSLHNLDSFPTDIMGYKIGARNTTIRKRIFERADKLFRKYKDQRIVMTEDDARAIISYYGYFKHSDAKNYIRKTKVTRTFNKAKDVVKNANNNKRIKSDA